MTFARIGAVVAVRVEDYYPQARERQQPPRDVGTL
jgi:hypothetical protein